MLHHAIMKEKSMLMKDAVLVKWSITPRTLRNNLIFPKHIGRSWRKKQGGVCEVMRIVVLYIVVC